MRNTYRIAVMMIMFWPGGARAEIRDQGPNVNSRYVVDDVELSGLSESDIGRTLRSDMKSLIGRKYDPDAAESIARKLRAEFPGYTVTIKVKRSSERDHVRIIFDVEKVHWRRIELAFPTLAYNSKLGWSGAFDIPIDIRHNVFSFGLVDTAEDQLPRYAGIRTSYENRRVGTDMVQLRIAFDTYHEKWNPATEAALAVEPEVPGIYRKRQDFAPSLALLPLRNLKLRVGTSFQRFQTQYPELHTQTAYAGTADIEYTRSMEGGNGFQHDFSIDYSLRTATRVLESEFVYTRHFWAGDYIAIKGKNVFGAHFQGGLISGTPPLFERFSLGNSTVLRGWNKFDVAPLGGTRLAYGSAEYRWRPFHFFYDVGTVWDSGRSPKVRHSLGFGLEFDGFFMSLGFPVRLNRVTPIFMIGIR